jgi:glycosyltransferase involved in cell wall biosynthesis
MRKKVFFIVHEISPFLGSECSSGWNIARGLSKYHDLTIVFAKTNQFQTENYEDNINQYFISNGIEKDAKYIAIPQPPITRFLAGINKFISNKKSSTGNSLLYFLAYQFWQKSVFEFYLKEHFKENFEIVHQFNSLSFREPGYLYKTNIPLFWGPISGLDKIPLIFLSDFPFLIWIKNLIRNLSIDIQFYTSLRIKKTIKRANTIYTVTKMDYHKLNKLNSNTKNLLDVGAIINNVQSKRTFDISTEKLKCIWVGRLDRLKALDILIESINQSDKIKEKVDFCIVGDGVNKSDYLSLVNKYKLKNLYFVGSVNKLEVDNLMNKSHILIHTSIKEAASAVILEGLASGLPIVCHDAFGMSHAITDSCGFKVKFVDKQKSACDFRKAIENFLDNPNLIEQFSQGAYNRAAELSWDKIVQTISNDYIKI